MLQFNQISKFSIKNLLLADKREPSVRSFLAASKFVTKSILNANKHEIRLQRKVQWTGTVSTHSVIGETNSSSAQMELLQHNYVPRILFSIHGQKRAIMWKIVPGFLVMNSLRIFGISRVCHFLIHFLFSQSFY